jgi:hypothetical protein
MNQNNYGYLFNDIMIENDKVIKTYKNEYGKMKINNEKQFYIFISTNNLSFKTPKLLNCSDGVIELEYIKDSTTLTKIINNENVLEFYKIIKFNLDALHCVKIPVEKTIITKDLNIELEKKIMDRFEEFDWCSNNLYNSIKTVNGIKIKNVGYYVKTIKNTLTTLLRDRDHYNLIHGDTHLGNILIDKKNELYFIDPRGYFGETKLFGILEYDYAKLMFGISGYSFFDDMNIESITINDSNLEIDFIKDFEYIFESNIFDKITTLLCLSIWLGNNSCFTNINKKIISVMISFYYCEKYM